MLIDKVFSAGDKCKCGRQLQEIHCTACGSYSVEKKAKLVLVVIDNKQFQTAVFRCRRCSFKFNDTERLQCEAPAVGLMTVKTIRVADKIEEVIKEETKPFVFGTPEYWEQRKKLLKTFERPVGPGAEYYAKEGMGQKSTVPAGTPLSTDLDKFDEAEKEYPLRGEPTPEEIMQEKKDADDLYDTLDNGEKK